MITPVLKYIAEEINHYYDNPATPLVEEFVKLGNISRLESSSGTGSADLQNKIILTVVNIDEEKTLKNSPHYVRQGEAVLKRNPTLFLNLYVLATCVSDDYETSLTNVSRVISFFQQKNVFTPENSIASFPDEYVEKIIMDLFSLNFEQINHLWGVLGGKYHPSVMYKLRLIQIQESKPREVAIISEIKANENVI